MRKKIIGVIGPNKENCTEVIYNFGLELGKLIIDLNYLLSCGGKQGIMEAVCRGAHNSQNYTFGCTIGIIPEAEKSIANAWCDIVVPTGIGLARNQIVVNTADLLIAVAGGAGTLSEIAFAWQMNKQTICYTEFEGWSKRLAGYDLDNRNKGLFTQAANFAELKKLLENN